MALIFWLNCIFIVWKFWIEFSVDIIVINTTWRISQQTFVLMKMPWRSVEDVFRLCLQRSSRRLDHEEYIRLTHTSSDDVLIKTNIFVLIIRLRDVFKKFSRPLEKNVFKTSSRRLQDVSRCFQDFFMTSSRLFQNVFKKDVPQKRLQDIFKTSSRRFEDVFKTSSRRLAKMSSRRFQEVLSS